MWVWSLSWEDSLEQGMAAHSSILAWRIPGTEKPGTLQSAGLQRTGHDEGTEQAHEFIIGLIMGEDAIQYLSGNCIDSIELRS